MNIPWCNVFLEGDFVLLCLFCFERTCDSGILLIKPCHRCGSVTGKTTGLVPKKCCLIYGLAYLVIGTLKFCPWFHGFEMWLWLYVACKLEWDLPLRLRIVRITRLTFVSHPAVPHPSWHCTVGSRGSRAQHRWQWCPGAVRCTIKPSRQTLDPPNAIVNPFIPARTSSTT